MKDFNKQFLNNFTIIKTMILLIKTNLIYKNRLFKKKTWTNKTNSNASKQTKLQLIL